MTKLHALKPSPLRHRLAAATTWRYTDGILIAATTLIVTALNYWWATIDTRPPDWDTARHLWTTLLYLGALHQHAILPFLQQYHYYPPLVYWVTLPFYKLFGTNLQIAILSNVIWIAILLSSTYAIGRRVGGRTVGLAAMLLAASYPMFVSQFKELQLDAPLAAMVALALYLLISSEGFRRRGYTLAFGVCCGLGMLTKWTFIACIAVPALYALVLAVIADVRARTPRRVAVIGVAALLAYAICSPWYTANIQQFRIDMKANGAPQAKLEGDPAVGSFAGNTYYFFNWINQQLFLPGLALFGAGLTTLGLKRRLRPGMAELLLAVGGMYLIFTLLPNKDARYTLPALPAIAVISVVWLAFLGRRRHVIAAGLLTVYAISMFAVISFGSALLPRNAAFSIGSQPLTVFAQRGYIIGAPQHQNWGLQNVFAYVAKQPIGQRSLSYTGPDTIWCNGWDLTYYSQLDGVSLKAHATYRLIRTTGPAKSGAILHYRLPDQTNLGLYRS